MRLYWELAEEAFSYIPPQLEQFMNGVSSIVALIGVIFVASSVYFFEEKPLPPEDFSKSHIAPMVIGFAALALVSSYWHPLSITL